MYNEFFFCISRKINVLFSGYVDLCVFVRLFSLWRHQLQDAADIWCVLQLMMTFLYVETYVWTSACVAKRTSGASCSWWWFFLYVETYVWTSACVAKPTSGASCGWWWLFYMSKCTCGQVLVLQSRRLVCAAADDDFVKLLYSLQNCVIWRKIIFYCHHNYEKSHSKLFKN